MSTSPDVKKALGFTVVCLLVVTVWSCEQRNYGNEPTKLRIGLLPVDTVEKLTKRYTPLFAYVSNAVGVPHELIVSRDYEHLLELFHEQRVDLVVFGALTFLRAYRRDNAVPLVARGYKTRFTSYLLVRVNEKRTEISQFKDKVLGFGSRLSTSGHLMPRYFLKMLDIDPEKYFSKILYSNGHAETARWVRDGKVDVGAVNSAITEKMYEDGRLTSQDVRVLWKTPPFVDQVLALHPSVPEQMQHKVRDAFLSLTPVDPAHKEILDRLSADGFHPITLQAFAPLIEVAQAQGLLE